MPFFKKKKICLKMKCLILAIRLQTAVGWRPSGGSGLSHSVQGNALLTTCV